MSELYIPNAWMFRQALSIKGERICQFISTPWKESWLQEWNSAIQGQVTCTEKSRVRYLLLVILKVVVCNTVSVLSNKILVLDSLV